MNQRPTANIEDIVKSGKFSSIIEFVRDEFDYVQDEVVEALVAIGAMSEAKKLWSTPIAAQSGLQDIIQSCGLLSKMIIEGEDFDPYYHSGRFAGEHKLSVYVQRRIPIWRGIKTGFIDIVDSNSYYKMGDNMLGILPVNHWANLIKGEED